MWTAGFAYWLSMGTVSYTYAGYPLLVVLLSKVRPKSVAKAAIQPSVSVVVAAHNEAQNIGTKIENLLALDYPKEKLQIIVASDGSTDETNSIVEAYADRGVVLVRLKQARGKPSALNEAVSCATGDVVVFCDARQRVDANAISALVACLADPTVGSVSGELHMEDTKGPGAYWKYEKVIRNAESRVGSVPGVTGALHAMRRSLFEPIPRDAILDDMFTPLQVMLRGYRVVFEPEAKAFDREADTKDEFRRKARTLAGNYQLLSYLPDLLNPLRNRIFWQFTSHKLLRLICPFALVSLYLSNVVLVLSPSPGWPIYVISLGGQSVAYALAIYSQISGKSTGKAARLAHTFVVLNAAAVEGLRRYLRGDFTWTGSAN
ncbi:MAG TPA: glycosyltransferase family 2 protein [Polyangiaceae bacterium]|nr:glycosyltransferase family 2 protein [Polyangiaceae bacterium]